MENTNVGLVVEGGGMRGAYTAGVLAALHDNEINFPYIIGVSAGANNSVSFLSKQHARNKRIYTEWVLDKRFIGISNYLKYGTYFGMNFIFDELPNKYELFDYDTFYQNKTMFKVGVADCVSGEAVYFEPLHNDRNIDLNKILRASSSLPLVSKIVSINNHPYLDGGIIDPIPIKKAMADNYHYNVVILTRNNDYIKEKSTLTYRLSKLIYRKYPKFLEGLKNRHIIYNNSINLINSLKEQGDVFVFNPQKKLELDRFESDSNKLVDLYDQGYDEATKEIDNLKIWLEQKHK